MEKLLSKKAIKVSTEGAFILLTLVCAVALPQILHGAGVLLGIGGRLGQILLPMYLPVLIIGFYRGLVSGALTGLAAPLISFWITEMPTAVLLPFITIELIATGLLAGIFSRSKLPAVLRVLSVVVIAKLGRLIALAISLYATNGTVSAQVLFDGILTSVPGVLLQLVLLTILLTKKEKKYE